MHNNNKRRLHLHPKEVRAGEKNAILPWEETTGGLEAMRQCLKEQMEEVKENIKSGFVTYGVDPGADLPLFDVPPIVHSTFLRFWQKLSSSYSVWIKQAFELESIRFPNNLPDVEVDLNAILAMEDVPCMHVNKDNAHVLFSG